MPEHMDTVIECRWIIPVQPENIVLEHHAVGIRNGRIQALGPIADIRQRYSGAQRVELTDHVLIPGLVNLHTHAAMSLMRGIADDLPLMDWLTKAIWPRESKFVSHAFVRDGTLLAAAEMLRGGITCFNDMYFFPGAAAEIADEVGIRAAIGLIVIEFPSPYAPDAESYLARGMSVRDVWRDHPLVSFCIAPHAPYTISDATFLRVLTLADQLEVPIHTHIHETSSEIAESIERHGMRPLQRLSQLGVLGPNFIGVHAVHLDTEDVANLARHNCSIAHCPTSNLKLASGVAPVTSLQSANICVGLGTDGAASNNRLDMLQEMRHAALLAKGAANDATLLDAHAVLRMATLNGAKALGLDQHIGSIACGKAADLCAIALSDPLLRPCFNPVSHLVYVAGRNDVSHVWVNGCLKVKNQRLLQINNSELRQRIDLWENQLSA